MNIEENSSFINGWIIDDLSICDEIIEFIKISSNKHEGVVFRNGQTVIDKTEKLSIECSLLDNVALANNYAVQLQTVCDKYIKKYPYCDTGAKWGIAENINVQWYPKNGGYFNYHYERNCGEGLIGSRHLVFMTYLNDINDGGETEFLHQNIKIKPKKGLTVIFPADWTFTHRGVTSPTEEKFIVTGWYNYL